MLGLIKKLFGAKDAAPAPVEAAAAPVEAAPALIVDTATADIAIAQLPDPRASVAEVAPAVEAKKAPAKKSAPKKPPTAKKPATAKPKAKPAA